jgi:hypothetical protein
MGSIPFPLSLDQNMEGWMTCYIRDECKRSAPSKFP